MKHYKPTNNRSYNDLQPADFKPLSYIYKEALWAGMCLYHKEYKKWWTPEQFYEEYSTKEMNRYDVNNLLENLVVRDPIGGINAANKQLDELEAKMQAEFSALRKKLQDFSKEIIIYYQSKIPKK